MQSNPIPPPTAGRSGPSSKSGFTARQTAFLLLLGLLGLAVLGTAAFFLFSPNPTGPAAAAVEPSSPTASQAVPEITAVEQATPIIPIPAECAKSGSTVQEGPARVIDGQTLEVTLNGIAVQVQFAGVKFSQDSPTDGSFLESRIAGQPVVLVKDVTDSDANGRLVRYVFAGGTFVNDELVRQGFARADYNTADRACIIPFQISEQQARIDRLGIWQSTPVPTATFIPLVTLDTSQQSCDCSRKYTCNDFQTHAAAQTCFNACNDYSSKLDEDHNGIACETLP